MTRTRRGAPARGVAALAAAACLVGLAVTVPARSEAAWSARTAASASLTTGEYDTPGSYPRHILGSTPMGYWRLDETGTGTSAANSTEEASYKDFYTGTYVNGPTLGLPPAVENQTRRSVGFNGTDQYVNVVDDRGENKLDFLGLHHFSVALWVYPTSRRSDTARAERLVAVQSDRADAPGWALTMNRAANDARRTIEFHRMPGETLATDHDLPVDTWSHVVAVFGPLYIDGTAEGDFHMVVYVNGTEVARRLSTASRSADPGPLTIGAGRNGVHGFSGRLDDVALLFFRLSPVQVRNHYDAGTG